MRYFLLMLLATVMVCGGCSNVSSIGDGGTTDADTDTDSDTDSDTDTDTDSDTDTDADTDSDTDTNIDTDTNQGGILCGWGICFSPQVCCVVESPPSQNCVDQGDCAGFSIVCDGPEDCGPDHECCLPSGAVMSTYCFENQCMSGLSACHTVADCDTGEDCCPSVMLGWANSTCLPSPCP